MRTSPIEEIQKKLLMAEKAKHRLSLPVKNKQSFPTLATIYRDLARIVKCEILQPPIYV